MNEKGQSNSKLAERQILKTDGSKVQTTGKKIRDTAW
jgi:hypothetical protein